MSIRTRSLVFASITCLALSGCWEEEQRASPPNVAPRTAHAATKPAGARPQPARPPAPKNPLDARSPWAPARYAPALGLDVADGVRVSVDPHTGEVTVHEVDLITGSVTLRRARTSGFGGDGLFGRGWVSELDSCLKPVSTGYLVSRVQGLTFFAPVEEGVYVSAWGEPEFLHKTAAGFQLLSALERTLSFGASGTLTAVTPGYTLERSEGAIRLRTAEGAVEIALEGGHVASVSADALKLRYRYEADELVAVEGALSRRYRSAGDRLSRISKGSELLLELDYDAEGRVRSANEARYAFVQGGDAITSASVTSPRGTWRYRLSPDAWDVETPRGRGRVAFDDRGRVAAVLRPGAERGPAFAPALPSSTAVELARDVQGRVVSVAAGGAKEEFAYDGQGRLASRRGADGRAVQFAYDERDQVASRTDASGETRYARDARARLTQVTTPGGRSWSFTYDGAHLATSEGPMGRLVTRRDAKGRVIGLAVDGGRNLSLSRDVRGRPLEVFSGAGERVTWRYDDSGLRSMVASLKGATHRLDLERARDPEREQVRVTVDGKNHLDYTFAPGSEALESPWGSFRRTLDPRGKTVLLETPAGPFRFAYDRDGRRTGVRYPSGVVSLIQRDALGDETVRVDNRDVLFVETERDGRHERSAIRRNGEATQSSHDAAGRLSSWRVEGGETTRYRYDADGNRVEVIAGEERTRLSYDRRGRLRRAGKERFEHDAAGRLTSRKHASGVDRFRYDGFGRLREVQRAGQAAVRYTYDPLGRWATRSVGEETVRYVYDGDRLLAELGPGERERVYVYGPGVDEPLAYSDGEEWVFLHPDELGHVLAYSNAAGERVDEARFAPFGEVLKAPGERPVFFAGRLHDPRTGLVNMRARVYDPSLGRFLTPDPAGLRGGLNAYVYVRNRPLTFTDPLGLWPGESKADRPGFWGHVKQMVVGSAEGAKYLLAAAPGNALKALERVKAGVVDGTHAMADVYGVNGIAAKRAREARIGKAAGRVVDERLGETGRAALKTADATYAAAKKLTSNGPGGVAARRAVAQELGARASAAWETAKGSVEGARYLLARGESGDAARAYIAEQAEAAGASAANAAHHAYENTKGVFIGAGYVLGVAGDADAQAGGQEAWARDIMQGGAESRALGAMDAYAEGVTFGVVDPTLSRFASDKQQAQLGRKFGDAGAVAFGLVAGGRAGLREIPDAFVSAGRAVRNPLKAARGFRASLTAAPAQTRELVGTLWANRQRQVYDSAANALTRPFANMAKFLRGRQRFYLGGPFGQSLAEAQHLAKLRSAQRTRSLGRMADAVADMKVASGAARPNPGVPTRPAAAATTPHLPSRDGDSVGALGRLQGLQSGKRLASKATPRSPPSVDTSAASGLGDLTADEVRRIQEIVNEAGEPLHVTGSAASSARRNPRSGLPVGKDQPGAPNSTQSDIDYFTSTAKKQAYQEKGLDTKLPKIDDDRITGGVNPGKFGPHVEFRPNRPPRFFDGDAEAAARAAGRRDAASVSAARTPLDPHPYARHPESRLFSRDLPDGDYVFVRDGTRVHVAPDGPHRHPTVLGGGKSATAAGDLRVEDGVVTRVSNASGTFRFGSDVIPDVLGQLRRQGGVVADDVRVTIIPWE